MNLNAEQRVARPSVAILIPCYNEETTIAPVVRGFRAAVTDATVFVYDNNSSDGTSREARAAGAIVRAAPHQGKGNVVRRMFADVDADVYVLVDGDMTYDPSAAGQLIDRLVADNLDMVVGTRVAAAGAFPKGHRAGNRGCAGEQCERHGDGSQCRQEQREPTRRKCRGAHEQQRLGEYQRPMVCRSREGVGKSE